MRPWRVPTHVSSDRLGRIEHSILLSGAPRAGIVMAQEVSGVDATCRVAEAFLAVIAMALKCGRSSVAEHQLPKLSVEGSIPFARSTILNEGMALCVDLCQSARSEERRVGKECRSR